VRDALRDLRRVQYDRIIDAQGLYKSAAIACLARGERSGYARDSAREPLAARTYAQRISAPPGLHAIERCRSLFAGTLGYAVPRGDPDYGLSRDRFPAVHASSRPYLVFNHASTWPTKSWPRPYWNDLLERAARQGLRVLLPWGNAVERGQSERLARRHDNADVLPELTLEQLAGVLANAAAVISVDTGPGHLTAALGTPGISIYGATDPALTGTVGKNQHHVEARFSCAPCLSRRCGYAGSAQVAPACYATVSPDRVWGTLTHILNKGDT
jgi:heptosyltransferase-1